MVVASVVMALMLAAVLLVVGTLKLVRAPSMRANAEHLGYSLRAYQAIGAVEVVAAAGLVVGIAWAPLGVAAAVGVVALLAGAVWSMRRVGDQMTQMSPALWVGGMAAATAVVTAVAA